MRGKVKALAAVVENAYILMVVGGVESSMTYVLTHDLRGPMRRLSDL